MCIFSLLCALALSFFDKRADRILKRGTITSGNFRYRSNTYLLLPQVYVMSGIPQVTQPNHTHIHQWH